MKDYLFSIFIWFFCRSTLQHLLTARKLGNDSHHWKSMFTSSGVYMWVTEKEQNHCQRSRFSSSIHFCWQGNNGQSLDGANQTLISNQDKEEHNNLQRRLKREDLFNFSYDYWSCFVWNSFQNSSDTSCSNWLACVVQYQLFLFTMFNDFFPETLSLSDDLEILIIAQFCSIYVHCSLVQIISFARALTHFIFL